MTLPGALDQKTKTPIDRSPQDNGAQPQLKVGGGTLFRIECVVKGRSPKTRLTILTAEARRKTAVDLGRSIFKLGKRSFLRRHLPLA